MRSDADHPAGSHRLALERPTSAAATRTAGPRLSTLRALGLALVCVWALSACGGGGDSAAAPGDASQPGTVATAGMGGASPTGLNAGLPADAGDGKESEASPATVTAPGQTPSQASGGAPTPAPGPAERQAACMAATPPAPLGNELVTAQTPVSVPADFLGTHLGLHVPAWKPGGGSAIPPPAYPYGIARTLKAEVAGLEERGFWSNIETAPGHYDWQYMDQWMAANAGHPVIWLVYGTPAFYQAYPGEPSRWPSWAGIASPPTEAGHAALARYAQAAKARYGHQIVAFEVWNEPTLPWTTGATSYHDRWTPAWGTAHNPGAPAPFFSGSASDLANIAYTLNGVGLGVPVLGAAFVDQWAGGQHTVTRFLNAPVTLPGGHGQGRDHIQGLSVHFYDYHRNPAALIDAVHGYRAKLAAAGLGHLPLWLTEVGAEDGGRFTADEPAAAAAVARWSMLGAALGTRTLVLYGHVSNPDAQTSLGDPVYGTHTVAALRDLAVLGGSTICRAAVLADNRVWLVFENGGTLIR